ncbi:MAG TPA: oligoendopeptidase F [Myxococcota bacterium]|nr:oligoendopeptidase F [Myxococcota bacterium]HOC98464.1 oligoendopeptidase F [Myxococcota bacterium]HOH75928.1 oligoendopeptidase F [Myxococcota bacterium]
MRPEKMIAAAIAATTLSFAVGCSSGKPAEGTGAEQQPATEPVEKEMKTTDKANGGFTPAGNMPRSRIPKEFTWDLSYMYENDEAWEAAFVKASAALKTIEPCRQTITTDPASLLACLEIVFDVKRQLESMGVYAYAFYSTGRESAAHKARLDRIQGLETKFAEASSFVEPMLLSIDPTALKAMVGTLPGLQKYTHWIDDLIRRKPHVLPPEQERLLALTGDLQATPSFMHGALESDVKFPDTVGEDGKPQSLTMASFPKFRGSRDRNVRREAVAKFFSTLKSYSRSFAASLDIQVKTNILNARARNYGSTVESALDANAVPVDVYMTLLKTTHDNLPRTLHRYVELRRRILGIQEVNYYDLYVPLFPTSDRSVSYEEGVAMTKAALESMGPEYNKVLAEGLDLNNRRVDVYPCEGKRSGAFCNGAWRQPPMVFLNFQNELDDVFTLAHEFGHALHFHLAGASQEFVNADTPIFLAEIASTFNEEMLLDYLLKNASTKEEKLYLLNKRMENIRTTVFRQVMFAEFELLIHQEVEKGGALTAERLGEIYGGLIREYYGPDFQIGPDDHWEWAYIPHFYYNYYVFQYATGLMSAIALSRAVREGGQAELDRYLKFLGDANSDFPVETLKKAGVDLTKSDAMQATFDLFAATLDQIDALVGQP